MLDQWTIVNSSLMSYLNIGIECALSIKTLQKYPVLLW